MQKEEVAQYDAQLTVERAARPERAGIHEAFLSPRVPPGSAGHLRKPLDDRVNRFRFAATGSSYNRPDLGRQRRPRARYA